MITVYIGNANLIVWDGRIADQTLKLDSPLWSSAQIEEPVAWLTIGSTTNYVILSSILS